MEYFAFQWHIAEACDQRCRHCYIYALGSHATFKEMALDDMLTVIENCKTFCRKAGRMPYLYITGGDPILHPQFWTLMKILKVSEIPFALMGNPFHLTAEVCRRSRRKAAEQPLISKTIYGRCFNMKKGFLTRKHIPMTSMFMMAVTAGTAI